MTPEELETNAKRILKLADKLGIVIGGADRASLVALALARDFGHRAAGIGTEDDGYPKGKHPGQPLRDVLLLEAQLCERLAPSVRHDHLLKLLILQLQGIEDKMVNAPEVGRGPPELVAAISWVAQETLWDAIESGDPATYLESVKESELQAMVQQRKAELSV